MITGIAILKKTLTEMKKASEKFFEGEVTISKRDCWLIGAILVLLGVALGLINAPLTHGININIASGNGNGNTSGNRTAAIEEDDEKEELDKTAIAEKKRKAYRKRMK